jgi:hypothetical protein
VAGVCRTFRVDPGEEHAGQAAEIIALIAYDQGLRYRQ